MTGIELSKLYYEQYGKPMLEQNFKEYMDRLCIGLVGHGSECFGFDDSVSIDHDFEPGFTIWLTEEDEAKIGFKLFRAYNDLPDEFMGFKVNKDKVFGSPYKGVHTINSFYKFYTSTGDVPVTLEHWMSIPDFYLAEATNGIIFQDPLGEFTRIRNGLLNRPEDIRIKKLASSLFYMAQAGQYNYSRCMKHHEKTAASLALAKFVESTADVIYLLNKAYRPYYKWLFKGLKQLPILSDISYDLEELMSNPYNTDSNIQIIENISKCIINELYNQGLTDSLGNYLEPHAYSVTNKIKDANLRNAPIML